MWGDCGGCDNGRVLPVLGHGYRVASTCLDPSRSQSGLVRELAHVLQNTRPSCEGRRLLAVRLLLFFLWAHRLVALPQKPPVTVGRGRGVECAVDST